MSSSNKQQNKSDAQKALIIKLSKERKRDGLDPFSDSELLTEFQHIRDAAVVTMKHCLEYNGKGLSDAKATYEYAKKEIKIIEFNIGKGGS